MSGLRDKVHDYLTIRRALGFKLEDHGWLLSDFVGYLEQAGAATITTELAPRWATSSSGTQTWYAARLSVVRGFARYLRTLDPATQVPPSGLLSYQRRRATPYLYSDADIGRLVAAGGALTPPLRAATYSTLLGLLAVTGLRVGEAIRLDRDDVDVQDGLLTVWLSKFNKSREVPLHPSTMTALAAYARGRDQLGARPKEPSFFVSTKGARLDTSVAHKTFRNLCRRAGLNRTAGSRRPRIHDYADLFVMPIWV
jgi:integrase/recombinase XerD